jgi:hypothetical protein
VAYFRPAALIDVEVSLNRGTVIRHFVNINSGGRPSNRATQARSRFVGSTPRCGKVPTPLAATANNFARKPSWTNWRPPPRGPLDFRLALENECPPAPR